MPRARRRRARRAALRSRRRRTATSTRVASRAWRRAFVTASCAIRNTAAATVGGTESTSPSSRTATAGPPASVARKRLQVGESRGRRQVGPHPTVRSTPTIARISRRVRDASPSIVRSTSAVASGSVCGDRRSRLRLDRDRRHVVRDGVVQVARELLAFDEPRLVELARPRPAAPPERDAERARGDRDREAADDVAAGRAR